MHDHKHNSYDAILVPGGGVTPDGEPTPWVKKRLERALECSADNPQAVILLLSSGTPHKSPPLDEVGQPIHESTAGARYLIDLGCPPEIIQVEKTSLDTIGNAYFARVAHIEPRGWQRLLVITSEHHLARTQAIFDRVFSLPIHSTEPVFQRYSLDYVSVPDIGLDHETLAARVDRERKSLTSWLWTSQKFKSLRDLATWIFTEHGCYAVNHTPQRVNDRAVGSY